MLHSSRKLTPTAVGWGTKGTRAPILSVATNIKGGRRHTRRCAVHFNTLPHQILMTNLIRRYCYFPSFYNEGTERFGNLSIAQSGVKIGLEASFCGQHRELLD